MKRILTAIIISALLLSICAFSVSPTLAAENEETIPVTAVVNNEKVLEAKIQSLLNLNNVFGDGFLDNETLVNCAAINLREFADDDGFIPSGLIETYIKDMYDIDLEITESINSQFPQKEGYVYLIPRGFTEYRHEIVKTEADGEYITVYSKMTADFHDAAAQTVDVVSLLIKNENSTFGFSILSSEIESGKQNFLLI